MKIVEITWADSTSMCLVWESPDCKPLTPMKMKSVGYLWEKTKDYVTSIQSIGNEQLGRRFSIPRGCIKKIKKL